MKKMLSLVLAVIISVSSMTVLAETEKLSEKGIAHGDLAAPSEWAREYITAAERLGITDYFKVPWTNNINRKQFCTLTYNMLDRVMDNEWKISEESPFEDADYDKITALYNEGIIEGKSDKIFAPDDLLTREEAAVILDRIAEYSKLSVTELYYIFNDENDISPWAKKAVQTVSNLGVMQGTDDNNFSPKEAYTVEQAITTLVRIFDNVSNDEFAYMTFADKIDANMSKDTNYIFSPLSVKMALLMAANGADGKTQREILDATNITDIESENRNIRLMLDGYSKSDLLKINVSNSVWLNTDEILNSFSDEYLKIISENFDAVADEVNRSNKVEKINGWVNDKTEGRIPTIVNENDKFYAMLVNAVYFKGRWEKEFDKEQTKKDTFTSRDGKENEIDFMTKTAHIKYSDKNGVTIVELPYLTRNHIFDENGEYVETQELENTSISMYLMMSNEKIEAETVLDETKLDSTYITLSVPKFKIEYSADLTDILKKIGIEKAFSTSADFKKMFVTGPRWIDSVLHKTYISVDEKGTEAAAVTSVGMGGSSLPPEPIEVKYNKPFTFIIKDNHNGEVLFMGEYAFAE